MNIDVVIPHCEDFERLHDLLTQLWTQTFKPRWIFVIDDSKQESKERLNWLGQRQRHIPIHIHPTGKPQLAKKFNVGKDEIDQRCTELLQPRPDYVFFVEPGVNLKSEFLALALEAHKHQPRLLVTPYTAEAYGLICWVLPAKAWMEWDERKEQDQPLHWFNEVVRRNVTLHVDPGLLP